jgi:hypothetical protein
VKKNIDFGEIGSNVVGFAPSGLDAEMEALLSGGLTLGRAEGRQLAATGSDGLGALDAPAKIGGSVVTADQVGDDEEELEVEKKADVESEG